MANANSSTSFTDNDFDKIEQHLREAEAISWLVLGFDKDIPREIAENIAESIHTRVKSVATLVEELWDSYREASSRLAAAQQLIAKHHKEGVDHHD